MHIHLGGRLTRFREVVLHCQGDTASQGAAGLGAWNLGSLSPWCLWRLRKWRLSMGSGAREGAPSLTWVAFLTRVLLWPRKSSSHWDVREFTLRILVYSFLPPHSYLSVLDICF